MAAKLIVAQALDYNGNILSGAKLDVYEAGTTTRRAIYMTSALETESVNPAVATADGAIAVWIDDTAGDFKAVLKNAAQSVTYFSQDDIDPTQSNLLIWPLGGGSSGSGAVDSVNGQTGVVVLDPDDLDDASTLHKFISAAELSKLAGIETGAQANTVDSVNTQTGDVVLDADDIDDTSTTNKFATAAQLSKLDGIEAGADVTDATNVTTALGSISVGALSDVDLTDIANGEILSWNNSTGQFEPTALDSSTVLAAGTILPWAGSEASVPSFALPCYGQAVSRTTYAALFSAIGTTYGSGDGVTTFNLPDLRGRALFGKDDMGGTVAGRLNNTGIDATSRYDNADGTTLGATGGSDRQEFTFVGLRGPVADGVNGTLWTNLDGISVEEAAISAGSKSAAATPPSMIVNWIIVKENVSSGVGGGGSSLVVGTDVLAYDANLQAFVTAFTLPTTDGSAGQFLKTDGAGALSFATIAGGGDLLASNNLSDLDNASTARTNLGVAIGSDVLAYDANLQSFVTAFTLPTSDGTNGQFLRTNGAGALSFATLSGGGDLLSTNNLSDVASAATSRTNLGLEIGSDVQSWTKGFVNVADYGVDLTGTTKDTTGVNNALSALASQGGGVLYFPPGTYKRDDELVINDSNIHIVHAAGAIIDCSNLAYTASRNSGCAISFEGTQALSTTLASSAAEGATTISVTSATGVAVGQLVFLASTKLLYDASGLEARYTDANRVVGVSGTTITLEYPLHLPFSVSGETVTVSFHSCVENVSVTGGEFLGGGVDASLANGIGRTCIHILRTRNAKVKDCKIVGFQGTAIWSEYSDTIRCENVDFEGVPAGTTIVENQNSGFYGFYMVRGRDAIITNCSAIRVRHVCDAVEFQDYIQANNKAFNTHRAAFGSHESVFNLTVASNKVYNCYAGGVVRAFTSRWMNNSFLKCTTSGMTTSIEADGDLPGTLEIIGNRIEVLDDVSTSAAGIAIDGYYSPLVIRDNYIKSEGGRVILLSPRTQENVVITGNTLETTSSSGICIKSDVAESGVNNVSITNNELIGFITNGIRLSGCADISNPADRIIVAENRGYAGGESGNCIFLEADGGWWGENIVVRDNWQNNDASACAAIDTSPAGRFRMHPILENNIEYADPTSETTSRPRWIAGYNTSASTPVGNATVPKGAVIVNNQPDGSDPMEWVCTTAGTEGTISGVTASTTASSATVTLSGNDGVKVYPGCFITIVGSGIGRTRVVSLSSDFATATVSTIPTATQSGGAVARANPVWSAGPTLGAT